jgi:ribose transport system substrate-binding protein
MKRLLFLVGVLFLVFGIAFVGGQKKIKIGFQNIGETVDFWVWVGDSMERAAKKAGVELIRVDNKADGTVAVQNADNLINMKVDGIILYMNDSQVNQQIKEMCDKAKIPLLAVDIPAGNAAFFGGNNYKAGFIAGTELGKEALKRWGGQVDLYISLGNPAIGETHVKRMGGFIDGVRSVVKVPASKVVEVGGGEDIVTSQRVITDVLTAHPEAKHILIGSLQDTQTQGAFTAVEMANRQDQVLLAGQGPFASTLANLRLPEKNFWIGSTSYGAEIYGNYAVPIMIDMINGKKVPAVTYLDHYWLNHDNVNEHYPLK